MGLFDFFKKKKDTEPSCCCCGTTDKQQETASCTCCKAEGDVHSVKVLGAGCAACHEQFEYAKKAVSAMGLSVEVEYVTDMQKVMAYGVMTLPAIVVNEKVVAYGKVLKAKDVEKLLGSAGK